MSYENCFSFFYRFFLLILDKFYDSEKQTLSLALFWLQSLGFESTQSILGN